MKFIITPMVIFMALAFIFMSYIGITQALYQEDIRTTSCYPDCLYDCKVAKRTRQCTRICVEHDCRNELGD